ncbi:MAG: hypothetical protein ACE5FW_02345 [Candidatus Aenigmatarchaeota archaeon]
MSSIKWDRCKMSPKSYKSRLKKYGPPTSLRWCLECREYRTFKYNPAVAHSECTICGSRRARRSEPRRRSTGTA